MEKTAVFKPASVNLSRSIAFVKEYYSIKGYETVYRTKNNFHCFIMTKNSLYRRIIGTVPFIAIEWAPIIEGIKVTVFAEMLHGMNADVSNMVEKLFDISGLGISRKITNTLTDPLFGKSFCEEALLISEGAITNIK